MDGGGGGGGGRDRSTFDDDLFRCVDAMEVNAIEASAAEGARDGERQGRLEGEHAGIQAGFMIGLEIGFYKASIETWSNLRPDISKSKRFQTQVSKLSEAIQRLQSLKAGDHEIDNALSGMRSSYTLVCSSLESELFDKFIFAFLKFISLFNKTVLVAAVLLKLIIFFSTVCCGVNPSTSSDQNTIILFRN